MSESGQEFSPCPVYFPTTSPLPRTESTDWRLRDEVTLVAPAPFLTRLPTASWGLFLPVWLPFLFFSHQAEPLVCFTPPLTPIQPGFSSVIPPPPTRQNPRCCCCCCRARQRHKADESSRTHKRPIGTRLTRAFGQREAPRLTIRPIGSVDPGKWAGESVLGSTWCK